MASRRSAVRGPGSNQHQDKAPLPPRETDTAVGVLDAAASADPFAEPDRWDSQILPVEGGTPVATVVVDHGDRLTITAEDGREGSAAYTHEHGRICITSLDAPDVNTTFAVLDEVAMQHGAIDISALPRPLAARYETIRPRNVDHAVNPWGPDPDADLSGYVPTPRVARPPFVGDSERLRVLVDDVDQAKHRVTHRYAIANRDGTVMPQSTWVQTHDTEQLSGHKLHVSAETPEQVADLVERLHPIATKYGFGLKFASADLIDPPDNIAPGVHDSFRKGTTKGATVYMPRRATLDADTHAVVRALVGYRSDADIPGDTRVVGPLFHRFELKHDPGYDVDNREYHQLYRPAPR